MGPLMNTLRLLSAAVAIAALSTSCASAPDSTTQTTGPGYGESKSAAMEVCQPDGERAYLARLVCSTGLPPAFNRLGGYGPRNALPNDQSLSEQISSAHRDPLKPGEVDYHVVDGYEVACGGSKRLLYLDMYHCHQPAPREAPPGFSLR
jgi:hypothetical protein